MFKLSSEFCFDKDRREEEKIIGVLQVRGVFAYFISRVAVHTNRGFLTGKKSG